MKTKKYTSSRVIVVRFCDDTNDDGFAANDDVQNITIQLADDSGTFMLKALDRHTTKQVKKVKRGDAVQITGIAYGCSESTSFANQNPRDYCFFLSFNACYSNITALKKGNNGCDELTSWWTKEGQYRYPIALPRATIATTTSTTSTLQEPVAAANWRQFIEE